MKPLQAACSQCVVWLLLLFLPAVQAQCTSACTDGTVCICGQRRRMLRRNVKQQKRTMQHPTSEGRRLFGATAATDCSCRGPPPSSSPPLPPAPPRPPPPPPPHPPPQPPPQPPPPAPPPPDVIFTHQTCDKTNAGTGDQTIVVVDNLATQELGSHSRNTQSTVTITAATPIAKVWLAAQSSDGWCVRDVQFNGVPAASDSETADGLTWLDLPATSANAVTVASWNVPTASTSITMTYSTCDVEYASGSSIVLFAGHAGSRLFAYSARARASTYTASVAASSSSVFFYAFGSDGWCVNNVQLGTVSLVNADRKAGAWLDRPVSTSSYSEYSGFAQTTFSPAWQEIFVGQPSTLCALDSSRPYGQTSAAITTAQQCNAHCLANYPQTTHTDFWNGNNWCNCNVFTCGTLCNTRTDNRYNPIVAYQRIGPCS